MAVPLWELRKGDSDYGYEGEQRLFGNGVGGLWGRRGGLCNGGGLFLYSRWSDFTVGSEIRVGSCGCALGRGKRESGGSSCELAVVVVQWWR
ncbi:hypothetical protein Acr_04g0002530 [Actinidia rufa]|uniref:Uncharacterized protein n=1 Tax=Actinidia rufa TaxID=165716 RepID=A0A7J0EGB8_9ERIC|nr:hypothetical protein Acr_04g0002530 [Actinidia rufa]